MEPAHSSNRSKSRGGAADLGEAGGQVKRVVALACFLLGCGSRVPGRDDVRLQYIQLAVALGEHDPNSLDYYYGPPEWVAAVRASTPKLTEIRKTSLELIARLQHPGDDYLIGQLRAIAERA